MPFFIVVFCIVHIETLNQLFVFLVVDVERFNFRYHGPTLKVLFSILYRFSRVFFLFMDLLD